MTEFRVDFTNVETKNFDPVPTGRYLLAVTDFEVKESKSEKNPGAPIVNMEFTIQEPVKIGEMKTVERKLWANFMPTIETTLFKLKNFLECLGDDVSGGLSFSPTEVCARPYEQRLIVAKVIVQGERKVGDKTYDERNEMKTFYSAASWNGISASAPSMSKGNSLLP